MEPMTLNFGVMRVFLQRVIGEIKEFWILDFRLGGVEDKKLTFNT